MPEWLDYGYATEFPDPKEPRKKRESANKRPCECALGLGCPRHDLDFPTDPYEAGREIARRGIASALGNTDESARCNGCKPVGTVVHYGTCPLGDETKARKSEESTDGKVA